MAATRTLALLLLPLAALAGPPAEQVTIPTVIPYADGVGTDDLRAKCEWNTHLSKYIVSYTKKLAVASTEDLSKMTGPTLSLVISDVHAVGGGGMSGPKWATITGELKKDGQVTGSFVAKRTTLGGSFSACGTIDDVGKVLAKDIAKWLKKPTMNAKIG
jgi:hypothetical protein